MFTAAFLSTLIVFILFIKEDTLDLPLLSGLGNESMLATLRDLEPSHWNILKISALKGCARFSGER